MKGGANPPSNNDSNSTISSSEEHTISEEDVQLLQNLGFDEGELEMFFHIMHIRIEDFIERYLEIAQNPPHNLNWSTKEEAFEGNDNNKRSVAEDTLHSYYFPNEGIGMGGTRTKKTRTKKTRTKKTCTKKMRTKKMRTKRKRK